MRVLLVLGLALVLSGCLERKPVRTAAESCPCPAAPEVRTWLTNEENGAITYGPAPVKDEGELLPKPKDAE